MRLKKAQKEKLVQWVAEGLLSDEINLRAAEFEPPFNVSRQQVDHYRRTRKANIEKIIAEGEHEALSTGLSLKSERLKKLKALALRLERDLFGDGNYDYIWTDQVKGVGSGNIAEIVEYEEFNRSEIDAYRSLLDDISKELGHRVQKTDVTTKGESINKTDGLDQERNRAILSLADAIREGLSDTGGQSDGDMVSGERPAVVGVSNESR